ncbi:aldo/keto reductase [Rhodobacteraceae bacterium NNCM2]|nr:aldo/keto reductase [Coraliihabitans acroporae]
MPGPGEAMDPPGSIILKSGVTMPGIGIGTWRMGENPAAAEEEAAALMRALDLGITHFDTAEMYGDGGSEELIGRTFSHVPRDGYFLTSKFYPHNASIDRMVAACDRSLARLRTDYIDLYLLHWPGSTPIEETLLGAEKLLSAGKIRAIGISNFSHGELTGMIRFGLTGLIDVNQVMYNPARRGIEFDLLPLMQAHGITCIAYTPIEPERVAANHRFHALAVELGLSPAALALAWHMTKGEVCPIPKSARPEHVDDLARAMTVRLSEEAMTLIDTAFPPPTTAQPLDII